jgi:hypothetical protein
MTHHLKLAASSALLIPVMASALTNGSRLETTLTPQEDTKIVLHNPDMGWVFYEFGKQMESGYNYPDVGYVAIAVQWNVIERSEGIYDFTSLDVRYDYWARMGKKIMLRLMVQDVGNRAPSYILKRLAPSEIQKRQMIGRKGSLYQEIDCRNPFYQSRLAAFLAALANHYAPDGPRPIVAADLRGFGLWGEWHSGFVFPGLPPPGTQNPAAIDLAERTKALHQIVDIWAAAMPNLTLLLSYSHDPDSPTAYWNAPRHYRDFLRYSAFDYATNKSNISWRRDGCGGAIKENERIFNRQLFMMGKGPLFSEFANGYESNAAPWAVQDALSLHPNYVCLYGYSGDRFYNHHRDLFDLGLRTMGYRFVPVTVTYPAKAGRDVDFKLNAVWVNRAVGRAVVDYTLALKLKDSTGKDVFSANLGALSCRQWIKGRQYPVEKVANLSGVTTGEYQLCLAVLDPRTGKPVGLPLKGKNADGSYAIGPVQIK